MKYRYCNIIIAHFKKIIREFIITIHTAVYNIVDKIGSINVSTKPLDHLTPSIKIS